VTHPHNSRRGAVKQKYGNEAYGTWNQDWLLARARSNLAHRRTGRHVVARLSESWDKNVVMGPRMALPPRATSSLRNQTEEPKVGDVSDDSQQGTKQQRYNRLWTFLNNCKLCNYFWMRRLSVLKTQLSTVSQSRDISLRNLGLLWFSPPLVLVLIYQFHSVP
jgi:hypothetical protein